MQLSSEMTIEMYSLEKHSTHHYELIFFIIWSNFLNNLNNSNNKSIGQLFTLPPDNLTLDMVTFN